MCPLYTPYIPWYVVLVLLLLTYTLFSLLKTLFLKIGSNQYVWMLVGVFQPQWCSLKIVGHLDVLLLPRLPMTQLMIRNCYSTVHFKLEEKNI